MLRLCPSAKRGYADPLCACDGCGRVNPKRLISENQPKKADAQRTSPMTDPTQDRPAGGSAQCPHSDLHFHLNNAAFGNTNLHYLEVTAKCTICNIDMVFHGPTGMSPDQPACSLDGKEIRLPFLAEGEELTGKPIGYSVTTVGSSHD